MQVISSLSQKRSLRVSSSKRTTMALGSFSTCMMLRFPSAKLMVCRRSFSSKMNISVLVTNIVLAPISNSCWIARSCTFLYACSVISHCPNPYLKLFTQLKLLLQPHTERLMFSRPSILMSSKVGRKPMAMIFIFTTSNRKTEEVSLVFAAPYTKPLSYQSISSSSDSSSAKKRLSLVRLKALRSELSEQWQTSTLSPCFSAVKTPLRLLATLQSQRVSMWRCRLMNWQSPRAISLMQSWLPARKMICCSQKHSKSACELFSTDLRLTFILFNLTQSVTVITHNCLADVLFDVPVSQLMLRFYTLELGRDGVRGRLTKVQSRSGRGGLAMIDCSFMNLARDLKKVPQSFWEDSCMAEYSSFRKQALSKELVRFSSQARCSLMRVSAHPLAVLSLRSTSCSSCEYGSRQLTMSCRICWFFFSAASFSTQARSIRSRLWQTAFFSSDSFFITFSTSQRCSCQTSCRLLRITCTISTQHRSSSSLALAFCTNSEKYWMKVSSEQTDARWEWSLRMQLLQSSECVEQPLLRQRKAQGCLWRLQSFSLS